MGKKTTPEIIAEGKRELVCILTDVEQMQTAVRASDVAHEIDQAEDEKKAAAESAAGHIKTLRAKLSTLHRAVRLKQVNRDVDCQDLLYIGENRVDTVRMDTGEVVKSRAATETERQATLIPRDITDSPGEGGDGDDLGEPTVEGGEDLDDDGKPIDPEGDPAE